jgi:hypothetical protein
MGMLRKICPEPGMTGRIRYAVGGEIKGWPPGIRISVTTREERMVAVCDGTGRQRQFPHWDADVGYETEFDGGGTTRVIRVS